jgi:hypothetical protein
METTHDPETYRAKLAADMAVYEAKVAAFAERRARVLPSNKLALFAALSAADIHTVVVTFDGYGDSGQIDRIDRFTQDNLEVELPEAPVEIQQATFETEVIVPCTQSPREIVETMAYDFLGETHNGWQDGEGAYGEFTFAVADQSITLDYNERFTDSTSYQHEF